ncbi:GNAT family N-acetyltransferase [Psychroserpens algicola]|uniref:GNAT family N-acetyltransferase n=1 Tax=Psychroserpens algicola TaxID=1719034 RepID=A0ABT0H8N5_9FLAO|nr:GNAT family N-acetyltransferase [Psychroserpens algicola]
MIILIKNGNLKPIFNGLLTRFYSSTNFIGVELHTENLKNCDAKLNISIRPFKNSDINALNEELRHRRLVDENIPNCYVAQINTNDTVYRQWVFKHHQNERIAIYFGPIFPKLKKDEAIIEGVFTHTDYRGLRIMPKAVYEILNQAHYSHLKRVIAFVDEQNIASLKGFYRVGFEPYIIRKEQWLFFKRKVSFIPLHSEVEKSYLNLISNI